MATLNPYLTFNGNCREAFDFYKSIFGGEFAFVGLYKDMPGQNPILESEENKIMHICLPISKEVSLLGADSSGYMGQTTTFGNSVSISINTELEEEARRIYEAMSAEGTIFVPLDKMFWGALFGMFTDKFGIIWMVNYDYNNK